MPDISTYSPERVTFASDLITTAVEGGTSYWAHARDYVHDMMDGYAPTDTRVVLVDMEDGTEHKLDVPAVLAILDRIEAGERFNLPVVTTGRYRDALDDEDAGQLDADDADAIAQLVAFGQITYG